MEKLKQKVQTKTRRIKRTRKKWKKVHPG